MLEANPCGNFQSLATPQIAREPACADPPPNDLVQYQQFHPVHPLAPSRVVRFSAHFYTLCH
jgi:hypothetical protein